MANSIANITGNTNLPSTPEQFAAIAANLAVSTSSVDAAGAGPNGDFMKFSKFGEWTYGQNNTAVSADSEWVLNPFTAEIGFTCWGNKENGTEGQNLGEVMQKAMAGKPMPDEASLPAKPGDWRQAIKLDLTCISEGSNDGAVCIFKSNSHGGRSLYRTVMTEIIDRMAAGNQFIFPVGVLTNSFYTHDSYGKIFTPVFEIVDWADANNNFENGVAADAAPEQIEIPETKPEPVQEPVAQSAPAPKRRRSRS
jgi:hypothetical protein